ncbi:MAG: YncE family protein [Myxococcota bacterium]
MSRPRKPRHPAERRRRQKWLSAATGLLAATAVGCLDNPGSDPQPGRLSFPIGMDAADLDDDGRIDQLFVANANFDLRFNAGSVHGYDIDRLLECASDCSSRDGCVIVPDDSMDAEDLVLTAHPCPGVLESEVLIGSFASALQLSPREDRLYVSVRSDSNLTFVDVSPDGALSCGGEAGTRHRCDDSFRLRDEAAAPGRDLELPLDPVGLQVGVLADLPSISASPDDDFIVVAFRDGRAGLFVERADEQGRRLPVLVDVIEGLPSGLQTVRWQSATQTAWLPSSSEPLVGRVGVGAADPEDPSDAFLFNAGSVGLSGIDTGSSDAGDTRDMAFDSADPSRAYLLSRSPEALLTVDLDSTGNLLAIDRATDLCLGPSRVEVPRIAGRSVAFVSCFDSDALYVIDPARGKLLGVATGGSGPFVMEVDSVRERLFLADFTSSVIRVLDLRPLTRCLRGEAADECAPRQVAILGIPRPVEQLR